MTVGDDAVDKVADTLQKAADTVAERGGVAEKAAQPVADDAAFVRKLKPSLVAKRIKGELPSGGPTAVGKLKRPRDRGRGDGPNPLVVVGAALALGIFLAKVLDWRSHAHPRD
jgi:hypothetical protein